MIGVVVIRADLLAGLKQEHKLVLYLTVIELIAEIISCVRNEHLINLLIGIFIINIYTVEIPI